MELDTKANLICRKNAFTVFAYKPINLQRMKQTRDTLTDILATTTIKHVMLNEFDNNVATA